MSRLDLLIVADSSEGGLGAAAVAHARWFGAEGWVVALAVSAATRVAPNGVLAVDLPPAGSAFDVRQLLFAAHALRQVLKLHRPRVVHVHGTRSQLVCLLAGRRPYVTMHGSGGRIEGQGTLGTVVRRVARYLAARLAVRAYSAAPTSGRWETLLHASPRLAHLERSSPPVLGGPTFLWVGRLDAPKQPEVFVRACALAVRQRPLRGVVIGDGPQMASCRRLAAELKSPVEFLGERSDVREQLAEAWATCLFSGFEGVPFAVQEAMWVGRAVVLSSLPSLRWFAADAAIYADESEAAAAAILALCDHDAAVAHGRRAAARVRAMLSPDAPFPRLLRDYDTGSASTER